MPSRKIRSIALSILFVLIGLSFFSPIASSPAKALELVMFSAPWCRPCRSFKAEVLPYYYRTSLGRQVPISVHDGGGNAGINLREPVPSTPTFVLVENDREVARFYGYHNFIDFFNQFGQLARQYIS